MTFADQTVYFACNQIDAGKQRKRSVAAIFVVTTREALPGLRRPIRMNIPNSLNSRLLVIRNIDGAVRLRCPLERIDEAKVNLYSLVEKKDFLRFSFKIRVLFLQVIADTVRLDHSFFENCPDRRLGGFSKRVPKVVFLRMLAYVDRKSFH